MGTTILRDKFGDDVACRPVAKWLLCKQRPLLGNARNNRRTVFFVGPCRDLISGTALELQSLCLWSDGFVRDKLLRMQKDAIVPYPRIWPEKLRTDTKDKLSPGQNLELRNPRVPSNIEILISFSFSLRSNSFHHGDRVWSRRKVISVLQKQWAVTSRGSGAETQYTLCPR
jgi:hypothetical protein